jgi:hypothetical protein
MRRLLKTAVLVGLFVLGVSARAAIACPRGYESWIRLAMGAHHIAEVEVLSTEDETSTTQPHGMDLGGTRNHPRARARVRGGGAAGRLPTRSSPSRRPYDSCAPYPRFLRFDAGAHLTLLAHPVPPGTEEIAVRGAAGSPPRGRRCLARDRRREGRGERRLRSWARRAEGDGEAAKMLATRGADGDWTADVLRALPYPVLAGLAELQRDPTRPWRPVSTSDEPATPTTKSYDAGRDTGSPFPPRLADELARRSAADAKEKADVIAFHRAALASWLEVDLGQPPARAARFVASVSEADCLREVLPLDGLRGTPDDDREIHSVSMLLDLASDEPDGLVWRQFLIGALDPAVFAPWLRAHAKDLPTDGPYLAVTLAVRSPEAAPHVEREFADAGDSWRMDDFLEFFVAVGHTTHADEVMRRLTRLVDRATAPNGEAKERGPRPRARGRCSRP